MNRGRIWIFGSIAMAAILGWIATMTFGPGAVRRNLSHLIGVNVADAPIEEYAFPDEHPYITEPLKRHIKERNPLFVGRDRCLLPFLLTVDIAGGGPGNIQADRYYVLWLPGFTRRLHRSFLWHTEW